ncbi:MAG: type II secretion system F family protein [Vulcanimicrobiaceae bacterium]
MPSYAVIAYRPKRDLAYSPDKPETFPHREALVRIGRTPDDVVDNLVAEGYSDVFVVELPTSPTWRPRFAKEKILLYQQLARLIGTSDDRNKHISVATDRKRIPSILSNLFESSGKFAPSARNFLAALGQKPVYLAMQAQPDIFDSHEVNILQIGDGGNEGDMFALLAQSLKLEYRIARKAAGLAVYPLYGLSSIIALFGIFEFWLLPVYVANFMPHAANVTVTQTEIISRLGTPLAQLYELYLILMTPVIDVGILLGCGVIFFALRLLVNRIEWLRYGIDWLRLFMFGDYSKLVRLQRSRKLLGVLWLLLKTNQQRDAYSIARSSAIGPCMQDAMQAVITSATHGGDWATHLKPLAPIMGRQTIIRIIVAEESGVPAIMAEMDRMVGEFDEDEIETMAALERQLSIGGVTVLLIAALLMFGVLILPLSSQLAQMHP